MMSARLSESCNRRPRRREHKARHDSGNKPCSPVHSLISDSAKAPAQSFGLAERGGVSGTRVDQALLKFANRRSMRCLRVDQPVPETPQKPKRRKPQAAR